MSGNKLLFDTNILINHLAGKDSKTFSLIKHNYTAISIISKIEVLGFHNINKMEESQSNTF